MGLAADPPSRATSNPRLCRRGRIKGGYRSAVQARQGVPCRLRRPPPCGRSTAGRWISVRDWLVTSACENKKRTYTFEASSRRDRPMALQARARRVLWKRPPCPAVFHGGRAVPLGSGWCRSVVNETLAASVPVVSAGFAGVRRLCRQQFAGPAGVRLRGAQTGRRAAGPGWIPRRRGWSRWSPATGPTLRLGRRAVRLVPWGRGISEIRRVRQDRGPRPCKSGG